MASHTHLDLEIPADLWQALLTRMAAQRHAGEETLGFLLCDSVPGARRRVAHLKAAELRVPGREDFRELGRAGLELAQDWHLEQLLDPVLAGRTLVQIHSHPGLGTPHFSLTDDEDERRYAAFLHALPGRQRRLFISGVLSEDYSQSTFRSWRAGSVVSRGDVRVRVTQPSDERLERQRVFGEGFRARLDSLRVCLVGCGGLGSIVAEQLSRLGVRHWVLVDPDHVETSNLNRLPGSTAEDAAGACPKVDYAARLIRTFWGDQARLELHAAPLEDLLAGERPAACDWVILATDNHASRLRALQLWKDWDCRLLNLATDVQVQGGAARMWARVTLLPADHSWCLVCADALSLDEAAREEAGPELRERLHREGYLQGVAAPAVYHLNGICASWGVSLLHQAVLEGGLTEGRNLVLSPSDSLLLDVDVPEGGCWHCAAPAVEAVCATLPDLRLPALARGKGQHQASGGRL